MPNSLPDAPVGATLTDEQRAFIDGLRELASFLEAHPEIPATYGLHPVANVNQHRDDAPDPRERLAQIARTGGRWTKDVTDSDFQLRRRFGPHELIVFANRESVCERVVTGTRTATVPDPDAPQIEVEEEIVEWVCAPAILAEVGGEHA